MRCFALLRGNLVGGVAPGLGLGFGAAGCIVRLLGVIACKGVGIFYAGKGGS